MRNAEDNRNTDGDAPPLSDAEIEALLTPLLDVARIAAAVSGGPDSTGLMASLARWRRIEPAAPPVDILTVDHGLRPEAAQEAALVCRQAAALGLPCHILRWEAAKRGPGLQERARAARYRLLGDWCARHGAVLVTAHTMEDQAETLLMRLRRGAGVEGLASMAMRSTVPGRARDEGTVEMFRPLLGVARARLAATAAAAGLRWVEDPSNRDDIFERVRMRAALALLSEYGFTTAALARSARRLGRAREALRTWTGDVLARHLSIHRPCFATIAEAAFDELPEEVRLRILTALICAFGHDDTRGHPPALGDVERLLAAIDTSDRGRWHTLRGALIGRRRGQLSACREPGRIADVLVLGPGDDAGVWDGRVHLTVRGAKARLKVVAFGALRGPVVKGAELSRRPDDVPPPAWQAQPAVVHDDRLIALPLAGRVMSSAPFRSLRARVTLAGLESARDGACDIGPNDLESF